MKIEWLKDRTFYDGEWRVNMYFICSDTLNIFLNEEVNSKRQRTRYIMTTNLIRNGQAHRLKADNLHKAKRAAIKEIRHILRGLNEEFRKIELIL